MKKINNKNQITSKYAVGPPLISPFIQPVVLQTTFGNSFSDASSNIDSEEDAGEKPTIHESTKTVKLISFADSRANKEQIHKNNKIYGSVNKTILELSEREEKNSFEIKQGDFEEFINGTIPFDNVNYESMIKSRRISKLTLSDTAIDALESKTEFDAERFTYTERSDKKLKEINKAAMIIQRFYRSYKMLDKNFGSRRIQCKVTSLKLPKEC